MPHTRETKTVVFKPELSLTLIPNISPPKPIVESAIDKTSILGLVKVVTFSIVLIPKIIATMAKGKTMKNSQCQFKYCKIIPDTVGPIAGANTTTIIPTPIAAPRLATGYISTITPIIIVSSIPAPMPWTTREISNAGKVCAKAPLIVPMVNMIMAARNSVLVLIL